MNAILTAGGRQYGASEDIEMLQGQSRPSATGFGAVQAGSSSLVAAPSSQESYGHAIDEFIAWYCSEPRLAFNRTIVLRYRFFLEQKDLAPSTINVRLAAVRRLAYEASDTGLLSPAIRGTTLLRSRLTARLVLGVVPIFETTS